HPIHIARLSPFPVSTYVVIQPSFPTRRSSDLEPARPELEDVEPARDLGAHDVAVVPVRGPRPGADELGRVHRAAVEVGDLARVRSEEHTSELQSRVDLVCRLLL